MRVKDLRDLVIDVERLVNLEQAGVDLQWRLAKVRERVEILVNREQDRICERYEQTKTARRTA